MMRSWEGKFFFGMRSGPVMMDRGYIEGVESTVGVDFLMREFKDKRIRLTVETIGDEDAEHEGSDPKEVP